MAGCGILQYCKLVPSQSSSSSSEMPDSNGTLRKKIPLRAIELANTKVSELTDKPRGRPPYSILTSAQRFEVGKQAAEHGVSVSIRYFSKTFTQRNNCKKAKNLYQSSLKLNRLCDSLEDAPKELPCKKTGQPLLIGGELDRQVQEYIREARKRGLAIY